MTEQHPLTDEFIRYLWITSDLNWAHDDVESRVEKIARSAADWQLEQVLNWLESELGRAGYGHEIDVYDVIEDLKQAMRPQQQKTGREGALQALDRLCEENSEGLKRLAQEDN